MDAHQVETWIDRLFDSTMTIYGAVEAARCGVPPELQQRLVRRQWLLAQLCRDVARYCLAGEPVPPCLLNHPALLEYLAEEARLKRAEGGPHVAPGRDGDT